MPLTSSESPHSFHIPVLGTGFSIDSPLKVAKYGISSVVSIVDDNLIEMMRKHHSSMSEEPFTPIPSGENDSRAERITAYLNLLNKIVKKQFKSLKDSAFSEGSEITKYFEMLPEGDLKNSYLSMIALPPGLRRTTRENELRQTITSGCIDVNIMTKLDRQAIKKGTEVTAYYSDATAALRGYAKSDLASSVVFSAGMNPRLFSSLTDYPDFYADSTGYIRKKIVLKVSDLRSAQIQGLLLAKKGLWVSEFRIESGLNCGGHAFATKGNLMGPILEEFHLKRESLQNTLTGAYQKYYKNLGETPVEQSIRISVQGGIGTSQENNFLNSHYDVDSVGWGTPFMLVPEATNLDEEHLTKLSQAGPDEVFLSQASPLGVLFWNLRDSASEALRRLRIKQGNPGAVCRNGFLAMNRDMSTNPLCAASKKFQKLKLEALKRENLPEKTFKKLKENTLAKACLCYDLAVSITKKIGKNPKGSTAVTPGPNIVNFSKVSSLKEMVAHIYGRINLLTNKNRPHVFIRELELYQEYLANEIENKTLGITQQGKKYFLDFYANLLSGIQYYREISDGFIGEQRSEFQKSLERVRASLSKLLPKIECFSE